MTKIDTIDCLAGLTFNKTVVMSVRRKLFHGELGDDAHVELVVQRMVELGLCIDSWWVCY